jgi:hypothetical protein
VFFSHSQLFPFSLQIQDCSISLNQKANSLPIKKSMWMVMTMQGTECHSCLLKLTQVVYCTLFAELLGFHFRSFTVHFIFMGHLLIKGKYQKPRNKGKETQPRKIRGIKSKIRSPLI